MPAETAAIRTTLWMTAGAAAAVPALVVPEPDDPLLTFVVHLVLLTGFSLGLVAHLAPLTDASWFAGSRLGSTARRAAAGGWLVVLVAGATGLVTLATGAALRFAPSLQFLQVLSALDIAWVVAAFFVGLRWWRGPGVAAVGGLAMGAVCVWSIWNYLNTAGFTAEGGWLVDGGEIARLILPFDVMAAVLAVAAFTVGVRRRV
ncbi:MAG: hypothetical protein R3290_00440 [Acidimicrobiia bacterium]|nr:hypothetical protein [Acidimicrobiia bacterium]